MRTTVAAVAVVLACAAPAGAQPAVVVQASNLADVSAPLLATAQERVSAIFQAAGVTVAWVDETAPIDAGQLRMTVLLVHYTSNQPVSGEALGMAAEPRQGLGRVAYVFWDRIREHALKEKYAPDVILAFVIAHELGHLLLPPRSHAPYGVMSERVDGTAVVHLLRGRLTFTERQAAQMRERLLRQDVIQQARRIP